MSVAKVNLAILMRRAQKKENEADAIYCEIILDELLSLLEKNGLSSYFSEPLTDEEKKFLKPFLITLKNNIKTSENMVPVHLQCFLNINPERAKQLTLTFGVHLVDGVSEMLYLSWSKGIFDEE